MFYFPFLEFWSWIVSATIRVTAWPLTDPIQPYAQCPHEVFLTFSQGFYLQMVFQEMTSLDTSFGFSQTCFIAIFCCLIVNKVTAVFGSAQ